MRMSRLTDNNNQSTKRILIIDDEPDVALAIKQVLEANGFEADSYEDPLLAVFFPLVSLNYLLPYLVGPAIHHSQ